MIEGGESSVRCDGCGYSKTGLVGRACPECGCIGEEVVEGSGGSSWGWLVTLGALVSPFGVLFVGGAFAAGDAQIDAAGFVCVMVPVYWTFGAIDLIARSGVAGRLQPSTTFMSLLCVVAVAICLYTIVK
ncbi:MAG: hypothetical protein AAF937_12625 [Planctomycetota bacterium]